MSHIITAEFTDIFSFLRLFAQIVLAVNELRAPLSSFIQFN